MLFVVSRVPADRVICCNAAMARLVYVLIWLFCISFAFSDDYVFDDSVGLGRHFDGVGAISGGGVSVKSRRLRNIKTLGCPSDWNVHDSIEVVLLQAHPTGTSYLSPLETFCQYHLITFACI